MQQTLLSIPGHARHYAVEIRRMQKEVAGVPTIVGPRTHYDRQRALHFKTISHLPSPETLAVLGEFLSDDIDTPVPLNSPGSDWGENPRANSYFAAGAINEIGLRNPPMRVKTDAVYPDDLLAATRAWWEDIESGKKTFSFVGQPVEYRFQPDGTVISTPVEIPEEESKQIENAPRESKKSDEKASKKTDKDTKPATPTSPSPWLWISAAIVLLAAIIGFFKLRKS